MNPTTHEFAALSIARSIPRFSVCGVPVDAHTRQSMLDQMLELSEQGRSQSHVCYVNAHVCNLASRDAELHKFLDEANICYADGMSIVWAARRHGIELTSRMTAADFFPEYLRQFTALRRRVFLLGGRPGVVERATGHLRHEIPDFEPVGVHHGYLSESLSREVISQVNAARADILLVGMGSPQQEHWIAKHRAQLNVPLVWAVGALFDYSAGVEKRCPRWMGDNGLEWLYRLTQQPRKMAARYLLGNPKFVWHVLRHQWKVRGELPHQQHRQQPHTLQRHRRRPR